MSPSFALGLVAFCFGIFGPSSPSCLVPYELERGERAPLRVYLDVDQTHNGASGTAIELGIRAALSSMGGRLGGQPVDLVVLDHRANSRRSRKHLETFSADDRGLAVFGGMHSPPILAALDFIHDREILHLVPWAAAGPITRAQRSPNWVFRLSVDDSKAGQVLADFATEELGCRKPQLLLERTAWGRSNETTLRAALQASGIDFAPVQWFDWGIGDTRARQIAREVIASGADSIVLVANAPEALCLTRALAECSTGKLPIVSHWGIMGASRSELRSLGLSQTIELSVLQTRAVDVLNRPQPWVEKRVRRAIADFPQLCPDGRVPVQVGFVHAYDLTLLLDAAVAQALAKKPDLAEDAARLRQEVRYALEDLRTPVRGLMRDYCRPFGSAAERGEDAHEALGAEDLRVVDIDTQGELRPRR